MGLLNMIGGPVGIVGVGWGTSRRGNCGAEGFQEVWREEINKKREGRCRAGQNGERG